jgi:hypothetical protein
MSFKSILFSNLITEFGIIKLIFYILYTMPIYTMRIINVFLSLIIYDNCG